MKTRTWVLFFTVASTISATATPILFNLRDTTATAEIKSGTILRGGVLATLTPLVSGGSGVLNQTGSSFGVNAAGSTDETAAMDGMEGIESISIIFNKDVFWTGLTLSVLTAAVGDEASLSIAGRPAHSLADTGSANDAFSFSSDNLVPQGQAVVLGYVRGNGFSFDSFSVDPAASGSLPDPLGLAPRGVAFAALIGIGGHFRPRKQARLAG